MNLNEKYKKLYRKLENQDLTERLTDLEISNFVSKYGDNDNKEFFDNLDLVINSGNNEGYFAFYVKHTFLRRNKKYEELKELENKFCYLYKQRPSFDILHLRLEINLPSMNDKERLRFAFSLTERFPNNSGVLNDFCMLFSDVYELNSSKDLREEIIRKYLEISKGYIDDVLINEKYSKFFWTKSRIYYILSETEHNESQRTEYYNIALSSIKKAWMTEKNGKQYNVRIMTYRSCEIYIKNNFLLESSRREVDKLQEKQNEIIQDINNEFNELKNNNLELLGLFVAIISFTIGTIQLNKQADFFSQACLIIVLMGGVLVVYGGLGIILHGKKYPLRSFLVILIGILLIILSMSTFIILKFGDA